MDQQLIVSLPIHVTNYPDAVRTIAQWAMRGESRSVCAANVHMVMEAHDDANYRRAVESADLITSDGVPLVWALRWLGWSKATRVYGPELTLHLLRRAAEDGIPIGLFGSTPETLTRLRQNIRVQFPGIAIAFWESPPFRSPSHEEELETLARIRNSGARLLFVGLGCPKQEYWMAAHKRGLPAVTLGVGAAFDFIAGTKKQAPLWMRSAGLEWMFRFATEPRRLWRRYTRHNPRFIAWFSMQLFRSRLWPGRIQPPGSTLGAK